MCVAEEGGGSVLGGECTYVCVDGAGGGGGSKVAFPNQYKVRKTTQIAIIIVNSGLIL